jgi:phospholipid transport system substrate-binding protein
MGQHPRRSVQRLDQERIIQGIVGLGSNKFGFGEQVMLNRLGTLCILLTWLIAPSVGAQEADQGAQETQQTLSAYDLVGSTTVSVMDVVAAADSYVDEDPERYYQQVQGLLEPLIDFRGFSRQVMGPDGSSKRYRSLDEAGRQQLRDQLDRFTEVMRLSLVRTYSKGLLAFGGSRIELEPAGAEQPEGTPVSVKQLIFADRLDPYEVLYQMGQSKEGDWKLRNVIIESVNLGEIYRDQFLASARQEDGDLDAVIDSWTTVTVQVEE